MALPVEGFGSNGRLQLLLSTPQNSGIFDFHLQHELSFA
jgi:hypothetical protein